MNDFLPTVGQRYRIADLHYDKPPRQHITTLNEAIAYAKTRFAAALVEVEHAGSKRTIGWGLLGLNEKNEVSVGINQDGKEISATLTQTNTDLEISIDSIE